MYNNVCMDYNALKALSAGGIPARVVCGVSGTTSWFENHGGDLPYIYGKYELNAVNQAGKLFGQVAGSGGSGKELGLARGALQLGWQGGCCILMARPRPAHPGWHGSELTGKCKLYL